MLRCALGASELFGRTTISSIGSTVMHVIFSYKKQQQEIVVSSIPDRGLFCPWSVLHNSQHIANKEATAIIGAAIPCNPMKITVPTTGIKFKGRYIK